MANMNPKHKFTKGHKYSPHTGSKKNNNSFKNILRRLVDSNKINGEIRSLKKDGTTEISKIDIDTKKTSVGEALGLIMLQQAIDGDLMALKMIWDRLEGLPVQTVVNEDNPELEQYKLQIAKEQLQTILEDNKKTISKSSEFDKS